MPEWAGGWQFPGAILVQLGSASSPAWSAPNKATAPGEPPAMSGTAVLHVIPMQNRSKIQRTVCLEAECHSLMVFVCILFNDETENAVRVRAAPDDAPASLLASHHRGGSRAQLYAQGRIGLDGALGVQWASNPVTHVGHIPLWGEIGLLAEKCHIKDNFSNFSSK